MTARRKALIIEDEPMIMRICERVFVAEGFDVDCVIDGLSAKEIIKGGGYELCLSDIMTPGMNGMELYNYLEQEHPMMTHRIIFTTGDLLSPVVKDFLKAGNKSYILKPFTPADLKEKIQQTLCRNEAGRVTAN
jgi:DNA-binding response OmpR family regulator